MFESHSKRNINLKSVAIGLIALVVISGAAYGLFLYNTPQKMTADEIRAVEIRDNTVLMLDYSRFSGEEFRQQILGKGRLEKFVVRDKQAYFTFPQTEEQEFADFVVKYFYDGSKLEFGKDQNGRVELGSYKLTVSPAASRFFRTDLSNVNIEPKQTVSFPYSTVNYTVNLGELMDFTNNSQVYGGTVITQASSRKDEPQFVFANHGIVVARPSEPSLKRLTDELLKDTGPDREARIQRLVDFVSNEIEYSYSEAVGSQETLKRPDETLMTRSGDCSNKTILLASLLEQLGEKYILLYCPRHITVAIPQGNFADENKLDFTWGGEPWLIAETTVPGFQVGRSRVANSIILGSVQYVQDPKNSDVIFDANSFAVLKFL